MDLKDGSPQCTHGVTVKVVVKARKHLVAVNAQSGSDLDGADTEPCEATTYARRLSVLLVGPTT